MRSTYNAAGEPAPFAPALPSRPIACARWQLYIKESRKNWPKGGYRKKLDPSPGMSGPLRPLLRVNAPARPEQGGVEETGPEVAEGGVDKNWIPQKEASEKPGASPGEALGTPGGVKKTGRRQRRLKEKLEASRPETPRPPIFPPAAKRF
eukprot:gene17155-biopygen12790